MITLEQVQKANKQYKCESEKADSLPKSRTQKIQRNKAHKSFNEWWRLSCQFFNQNKEILKDWQPLLGDSILNYLCNTGYTTPNKLEYCSDKARYIIENGKELVKTDSGFTQSYLMEYQGLIYFCSISSIIRFDKPK